MSIRLAPMLMMLSMALPLAASAYDVGDPVADIVLPDLEGETAALSDLEGQIILLNFFATWCPGCNEEALVLEQDVWQVYQEQGVMVVAINLQEPAGLVAGWAAAMGVTYPIWLAPDWSVLQAFTDSPALPYNTVIDRTQVLRYGQMGFDQDELIATIEEVLAEDVSPVEARTWTGIRALFRP